MKTSIYISFVALFILLCGFDTPNYEKTGMTPEEINAYTTALDSIGYSPEYFFNDDFLHPKLRRGMLLHKNDNIASVVANAKCKPPQQVLEHFDSIDKANRNDKEYTYMCEREKRLEEFRNLVKSKLTAKQKEIIEQQRILASEYCTVDSTYNIVITVSREDAAQKGISQLAYDNFAHFIIRFVNRPESNPRSADDNRISAAVYQIFFDDNPEDWDKDIIIHTPYQK